MIAKRKENQEEDIEDPAREARKETEREDASLTGIVMIEEKMEDLKESKKRTK